MSERPPSDGNATGAYEASHSTPAERFAPGVVLAGRYRIVAALGKGGMGEVWRADDLALGQPVALKFLPSHLADDPDRLARFRREVALARRVSHPNCCRVYDLSEHAGQLFLTMEYIDGEDLAVTLRRFGRLPEERAVAVARELCQGLAAVHEQGLLHRDLKPANVMLDGRGKARLTDFGLAAAAEDLSASAVRSGTPAYMAPEQLAGKEVTVRSDLFALGLVLYELFTGRKAFADSDRDTPPSKPTSHVSALDPAVERAILRCLERDPADRPRSALAVAGALPGGDPLAAAIAAGETPSPQMVADAGEEGSLRPRVAVMLLGGVLVGLAAVALLADRTKMFRQVPLNTPPEILVGKARELLTRLGHTDPPADSAYMFARDVEYVEHQRQQGPSPERWQFLPTGRPAAIYFWYRQSPGLLVANSLLNTDWPFGAVTPDNPPPTLPGMAIVFFDPLGRLLEFQAVPPRQGAPAAAEDRPDWDILFNAAGLERRHFDAVTPIWRPPVFADQRNAWAGSWPDRPGSSVRVEAAACGGKPVYFRIVDGPWAEPERSYLFSPIPRGGRVGEYVVFAIALSVIGGSAALAWRNLRLGRGDRRGAFRVAATAFILSLLGWVTFAHHVPSLDAEITAAVIVLGHAVYGGGLLWLSYLALEPFVRRRWPWRITAWNRLLAGRYRDPLVGRDVLLGALAGVTMELAVHLPPLGPIALGQPPATPLEIVETNLTHIGSSLFGALLAAIGNSLLTLVFLFLLVLILRREWLAAAAWMALFFLVYYVPGDYPLLSLLRHAGVSAVVLAVLLRLGVLSAAVGLYVFFLLNGMPITVDTSAWYFRNGAIGLAVMIGLAVYGFVVSLGGRPLVGKAFFGDE